MRWLCFAPSTSKTPSLFTPFLCLFVCLSSVWSFVRPYGNLKRKVFLNELCKTIRIQQDAYRNEFSSGNQPLQQVGAEKATEEITRSGKGDSGDHWNGR
uniref:Uncharacterized protein n=1 Tax=Gossypium raimondii TaxID=29730 RepID=A0A0D2N364_GOSRA|nr:hypothetical protein B456_004G243300 [Gossypium raimondii]